MRVFPKIFPLNILYKYFFWENSLRVEQNEGRGEITVKWDDDDGNEISIKGATI